MNKNGWRKSSWSTGSGNNCVEVRARGSVEVRDSKAPTLGSLAISRVEFAALLESVKLQRLVAAVHLAEVGRCSVVRAGTLARLDVLVLNMTG
ncbi:uncharacterized protein DUF397 [Stackebrandtia endophytica]|uniref:Uncharacterized protein DUF397 n=1 Tax=Stackebrandtia endophytica TaxID=1496996 RepID=A0A543ATP5_9ACTN|nr:DUF397 domain-containing protein [Stackebrandtia endophytica]TQL75952.1 uncharacterized protein DUF397 [Stackebrandtia endophytica]